MEERVRSRRSNILCITTVLSFNSGKGKTLDFENIVIYLVMGVYKNYKNNIFYNFIVDEKRVIVPGKSLALAV